MTSKEYFYNLFISLDNCYYFNIENVEKVLRVREVETNFNKDMYDSFFVTTL